MSKPRESEHWANGNDSKLQHEISNASQTFRGVSIFRQWVRPHQPTKLLVTLPQYEVNRLEDEWAWLIMFYHSMKSITWRTSSSCHSTKSIAWRVFYHSSYDDESDDWIRSHSMRKIMRNYERSLSTPRLYPNSGFVFVIVSLNPFQNGQSHLFCIRFHHFIMI